MIITAIKPAVRTAGRLNVFVDGKYSFSLDELQLVKSGISVNRELTEAELAQLKDESAFGKAYARALEYIFRRPRSFKEMRDYAWRKKWEPDMADRVIARLAERGYLDDAKFAEAWVRHRATGKPTSKRKLVLELRQKGVSSDDIEAALADSNEFDEREALRELIAKKRGRYDDEQKLMAYLARLGFSFEEIKSALSDTDET